MKQECVLLSPVCRVPKSALASLFSPTANHRPDISGEKREGQEPEREVRLQLLPCQAGARAYWHGEWGQGCCPSESWPLPSDASGGRPLQVEWQAVLGQ